MRENERATEPESDEVVVLINADAGKVVTNISIVVNCDQVLDDSKYSP